MAEQSVAAGIVRALAELAVSKGAGARALYTQAGIDPHDVQNSDNRIPLAKYQALMHAGQRLSNDPALALHFGEAFDAAEISIAGAIHPKSELLADSFELLNRYAPLVLDVGGPQERFAFTRRNGQVWIIDHRPNPNAFAELTESTFARMVCMARRHLPGVRFPTEVRVTHHAPAYRAEYDRVFQAPVVFDSEDNALVTDGAWVGRKAPGVARYATDVLSAHAESLIGQLEQSKTVRGRVESALVPLLSTGGARIAIVASAMGLSRQTLFRRLRTEGTTFEQVLDEQRRALAIRFVSDNRLAMSEIAERLGFSDATSLSRAFKRWTGSSPRAARPTV